MLHVPLLEALALFEASVEVHDGYPVHDGSILIVVVIVIPGMGVGGIGWWPDLAGIKSRRAMGWVVRGGRGGRDIGSDCCWRGRGEEGVYVSGAFLLHCVVAGDGGTELGSWGIDGGEGEDVKKKNTAVVQEMANCAGG